MKIKNMEIMEHDENEKTIVLELHQLHGHTSSVYLNLNKVQHIEELLIDLKKQCEYSLSQIFGSCCPECNRYFKASEYEDYWRIKKEKYGLNKKEKENNTTNIPNM